MVAPITIIFLVIALFVIVHWVITLIGGIDSYLKTPPHMTFQGVEKWHTYNFRKPALPDKTMVEIEYDNHACSTRYSTMTVQDVVGFDYMCDHSVLRYREVNPR